MSARALPPTPEPEAGLDAMDVINELLVINADLTKNLAIAKVQIRHLEKRLVILPPQSVAS